VDSSLYPDIVEKGGLAGALADAARADGIDLGRLTVPAGPDGYTNAVMDSDRGRIGVGIGADRRIFAVTISNGVFVWASGVTPDLREVVRMTHRWQAGATLRDLHGRFPFMTYSRLAQGYEDGNPVEVQWDQLLRSPDLTLIRPVLEAAHADERLRQLFPSVTHFTLARFELDHLDRRAGEVWIELTAGGYDVGSPWVENPVRVAAVAEAIAAAVAQLP